MNEKEKLEISAKTKKNVQALEKLRKMPKTSTTDNRIAAVNNLISHDVALEGLRHLKWPEGPRCPRCNSKRISKKELRSQDGADILFYECLDCKGRNEPYTFNDLSELPTEFAGPNIIKLMKCWYLMSFCSIPQIARELGVNIQLVTKMVSYLHNQNLLTQSNTLDLSENKELEDTNLLGSKPKHEETFSIFKATTGAKIEKERTDELDMRSRERKRDREIFWDKKRNSNKIK